jgi:simple sugar transport system permease protein
VKVSDTPGAEAPALARPSVPRPPLAVAATLLGALALFALAVAILGGGPLEALAAVVNGAVGSPQALNRTIARTIPLLLLSAGQLLAFRARFWYIGMNGAMIMGAVTASGIALYNPDAPTLLLPVTLLSAVVVGALWALIPGVLRVRFGAPEIIVSLMLNYIAQRIVEYLAISYWKDPNGRGFPGSAPFSPEHWLPRLDGTNVHLGLLFGLLALAVIAVLLGRTVLGLEIRFVGQSPATAHYLGLDVDRTLLLVAATAGALGGLAGASEVLGLNHRLEAGISQDLGYTAILVGSLGMLQPIATALSSLFVAGLLVGGDALQIQLGLPSALSRFMLWAILFGVICAQALRRTEPRA